MPRPERIAGRFAEFGIMVNKFLLRIVLLVVITGILCQGNLLPVSAAPAPNSGASAPMSAWGGCWYTVRRGDNLFRIAIRYGVSYWYLAQINGLYNPNYIYAGQTLIVPCGTNSYPPRPATACASSQRYLVKPKDNLFRIALNHGTTINAIRNANHLWGHVLRPGMNLIIPCPGSVAYKTQAVIPEPTPVIPPTALAPPTVHVPDEVAATVTLFDGRIDPVTVNIKAGQTVLWTNNAQMAYTIVSGMPQAPNNQFTSSALSRGSTFSWKFEVAGNYSYHVQENPSLIGQVNVSP